MFIHDNMLEFNIIRELSVSFYGNNDIFDHMVIVMLVWW